jgi:hypothetical protein
MKKAIILLLLLLCISITTYAINHMDLMTTMTGEHDRAYMGSSMASLDFNNDGYDDLVVCSNIWGAGQPPDSIAYGRIYFYWGGPDFDNIPDLIYTGSYEKEFKSTLCYLGDVNGDGLEDLGMTHYGTPFGLHLNNYKFSVFYGEQTPQPQPDFSIEYPYNLYLSISASALGDINGDGFDDIGLLLRKEDWTLSFHVIYGGSMQDVELFVAGQPAQASFFTGIGDVNHDGYSDFSIGHKDAVNFHVILYFGSPQFNIQNHLDLYSSPTYILTYSAGVGDVNGDTIDDFIGYANTPDASLYLWFGNSTLTAIHDVSLTPYNPGHLGGGGITSGDANNDGYNDVFGTNPMYDWNNGRAGLWLGRQQFNGTLDLTFDAPSETNECNFGDASTTGDYNGDGYCDYAVSAPFTDLSWFPWNGKVYVYAGNGELDDTTVRDDDQTVVPLTGQITLSLSPNPFEPGQVGINYSINGKLPDALQQAALVLYNVKGQVVSRHNLAVQQLRQGKGAIFPEKLKPGIYLAALVIDNKQVATTRLTVR